MKDIFSSLLGGLILLLIVGSYLFGATKILVDDRRYDTKDVVIGFAFFPYTIWVGGKELYKLATTTSEFRNKENKCLTAAEAFMPRNPRLRLCECVANANNQDEAEKCGVKIFTK